MLGFRDLEIFWQCSERQFDFVTFDVEEKRHRQFKSSTSNVKKKTST